LEEFANLRDNGYQIVKGGWGMHSGAMFGQDRSRDLEYVSEVRRTIGDQLALVVDVPGARGLWDVPTAIRRINELAEYELRWIEQPLPPHDLAGYARLRAAVSTPIGAGEDEWGPESYGHVIASDGVDIVQLDPGRCLGLTGCRITIRAIEAAGLKYSAHSWSSALNTAASLHMLAMSNHGDTLDFKPHESPMQHELVEDPWEPMNGVLALRDRPGLGVTVSTQAVARYEFS
jgi:L-alanine-DL-glutamate epimerase-like enolase superfamily enzyme